MTCSSLILQAAKSADATSDLAAAERQTDTHPTPAQIEAGNYQKGRLTLHGLEIAIENPKGSVRRGVGKDGKPWETVMKNSYGYILRAGGAAADKGKDGDHVDVFLGEHLDSELVFIVNQVDPGSGRFDEHKCVIGETSEAAARAAYLANYAKGWQGLGSIKAMTLSDFKIWLVSGDHKKQAAIEGENTANSLKPENEGAWNLLDTLQPGGQNTTGSAPAGEVFAPGTADSRTVAKAAAFSEAEARQLGRKLKIDFEVIPFSEFRAGLAIELEHRDVTGGDPLETARIAYVHLKEDPHYYTLLKKYVEKEAILKTAFKNCGLILAGAVDPDPTDSCWAGAEWLLAKAAAAKHVPTVAVDVDGTLAVEQEKFDPKAIGRPRPKVRKWLKRFKAKGWRIIAFTVRGDRALVRAWAQQHELPIDYVNENPDQPPHASGKVWADVYIDDRGVHAQRDWDAVGAEVEKRLAATK